MFQSKEDHDARIADDLQQIEPLYPFKSHFIEIHGYKYHYVDEGQGDHAMVMVHGNPTWSFMYRNLIKEFSRDYRVIAVDHLGCGLSDKPQNHHYRLEDHIDNLEILLLKMNLEKITMVVHDWGGAIGMGFAVRHPRRIASLIIFNSAAYSIRFMPWRIGLCRIPLLDDRLIRKFNLFVWGAMHCASVTPIAPEIQFGYRFPYETYQDRIGILRFVQDIPTGPESPSFESLLEVEHGLWKFRDYPVALVWGMQDWCFKPVFLERWKTYYPQASVLELPDAGHLLLEDAAPKIIPFLRDFLKE